LGEGCYPFPFYFLRVTGHRSQVTGHRSQVTGHRSQVQGSRSAIGCAHVGAEGAWQARPRAMQAIGSMSHRTFVDPSSLPVWTSLGGRLLSLSFFIFYGSQVTGHRSQVRSQVQGSRSAIGCPHVGLAGPAAGHASYIGSMSHRAFVDPSISLSLSG
jgi:hypothetical protein